MDAFWKLFLYSIEGIFMTYSTAPLAGVCVWNCILWSFIYIYVSDCY